MLDSLPFDLLFVVLRHSSVKDILAICYVSDRHVLP
jgi:hypothetical protein